MKLPTALVVCSREIAVPVLITVTSAPGITPPPVSVTIPVTVARFDWPKQTGTASTATSATSPKILVEIIDPSRAG